MNRLAYLAAAALACLVSFAAGPVMAGCTDYAEGIAAPAVNVCVGAMCQDTTIAYECGNIHAVQVGYTNSLRLVTDFDTPSGRGERTAHLAGAPISPGILTCSASGTVFDCFATP